MRPPEFTGGNTVERVHRSMLAALASMRPPEFTGGNMLQHAAVSPCAHRIASMRPPEFTGGNPVQTPSRKGVE